MSDLASIYGIYRGSDGQATRKLYDQLELIGPAGVVAVNLFRACKTSGRAKNYRGGNAAGSYRRQAYDRKHWSLGNLCRVLVRESEALGIEWGWAFDAEAVGFEHVLYVDLPTGQVSFHTDQRLDGHDYEGKWDGVKGESGMRICRWICELLSQREAA